MLRLLSPLWSSVNKKFCNLSKDNLFENTIFKNEGIDIIGKVIECTN